MKVFIWCPLISEVGTTYTILNTSAAFNKFSNSKIRNFVINVAEEWTQYKNILDSYNTKLIDLKTKLDFKKLPKNSYIKSRFSYLVIFLFSIFKLHKLLKEEKPDFLMIHILTPIPLLLLFFFKYNTKFILRISGYPHIGFFRRFFWKLVSKKIYKVLSPTINTKKLLTNKKVFLDKKIQIIFEPIINLESIKKKSDSSFDDIFKIQNNYVISIGRLTKQKNFKFLIESFDKVLEQIPDLKLIICGVGEEQNSLKLLIKKKGREKNIILAGYVQNIYHAIKNSKFFVLTSEWEDPGFVIVEAMYCNKIVLSSNCESGPLEIISHKYNGYLFEKNNKKDFINNFIEINNLIDNNNDNIKKMKIRAKRKTLDYSLFRHYSILEKIFN
tara:strand:- start:1084 stop:2238 length:1155 start_codon:yes stop_codon:yes gene_type:complete